MTMTTTAPGVYANIKSSGRKPIEATGTSTTGFIGQASAGPVNEATLITSWAQYEKLFGGLEKSNYLGHAVYGFFANGGGRCFICNVGEEKGGQSEDELTALVMGHDKGPASRAGIQVFNNIADISLVAAPGMTSKEIHNIVLDHCEARGDRFAILDCKKDLDTGLDEMYRPKASNDGACYFPWVIAYDPIKKENVEQPPSGFVAGLYSRTDGERGVHKAPANETLRGINGLKYNLSREDQAVINPRNINLIRDFGDEGLKVYGGRTLASDAEWKYINVRRLFLQARETIEKGTEWAVFEPNNQALWGNLKRNISSFLKTLWMNGSLVGNTPEEAFYVICDKSNNPQDTIDLGILNIDIGIAPVKPAEFININIQQKYDDED